MTVFLSAEEARENAALCAILYLEGMISEEERAFVLLRKAASPNLQLGNIGFLYTPEDARKILEKLIEKVIKDKVVAHAKSFIPARGCCILKVEILKVLINTVLDKSYIDLFCRVLHFWKLTTAEYQSS